MKDMRLMIARELNKIAKELIAAGNVANQPGEYNNFTGTIDWRGIKGQVKNAAFELTTYNKGIFWYEGTWENGTFQGYWKDGTWKNGTWKWGVFDNGTWENGTWKKGNFWNGTWIKGTWQDGEWHSGTWENGTWKDGVWYRGKDSKGKGHGKDDSPDKW